MMHDMEKLSLNLDMNKSTQILAENDSENFSSDEEMWSLSTNSD